MHMGIHVVTLNRGPVNCAERDGIGGKEGLYDEMEGKRAERRQIRGANGLITWARV